MSNRYRGERGRAFPDGLTIEDMLDDETVAELEALRQQRPAGDD